MEFQSDTDNQCLAQSLHGIYVNCMNTKLIVLPRSIILLVAMYAYCVLVYNMCMLACVLVASNGTIFSGQFLSAVKKIKETSVYGSA